MFHTDPGAGAQVAPVPVVPRSVTVLRPDGPLDIPPRRLIGTSTQAGVPHVIALDEMGRHVHHVGCPFVLVFDAPTGLVRPVGLVG